MCSIVLATVATVCKPVSHAVCSYPGGVATLIVESGCRGLAIVFGLRSDFAIAEGLMYLIMLDTSATVCKSVCPDNYAAATLIAGSDGRVFSLVCGLHWECAIAAGLSLIGLETIATLWKSVSYAACSDNVGMATFSCGDDTTLCWHCKPLPADAFALGFAFAVAFATCCKMHECFLCF